jgi:hypothetical protein
MQVECPACAAPLKARAEHIGQKVRCPKCAEVITIVDPQGLVDPVDGVATMACPMCGGQNTILDRTCHHCGEDLGGSGDHPQRGIWRAGGRLVMHRHAQLPARCVKTNQPADRWLRRQLVWHHPAVFLTLCAGLPIYFLVYLATRKKADIQIGLSETTYRSRRRIIAFGWTIGLVSAGIIFALFAWANPQAPAYVPALILTGLIGLMGIIWSVVMTNGVTPVRITDEYIWLRGVHRDYLDELPEWPGEE